MEKIIGSRITDLSEFYKHTKMVGACRVWRGVINNKGYGVITIKRKRFLAHRFAKYLQTGSWPDKKLCVMHSCDNRSCVNLDHLSVGTIADNNRDMREKGRDNQSGLVSGAPKKLNAEKVKRIREMRGKGKTLMSIANLFGISDSMVHYICKGVNWKNV